MHTPILKHLPSEIAREVAYPRNALQGTYLRIELELNIFIFIVFCQNLFYLINFYASGGSKLHQKLPIREMRLQSRPARDAYPHLETSTISKQI
jgi:hypothetical protein